MLNKLALPFTIALLATASETAFAQGSRYVIIVNPRNPIMRLSLADVSRIYLGKTQAWSINGQIEPVAPVDQSPDSPIRIAFSQRVLRKTVSEADSYWRQELFAGRNVPPPQQTEAEAIATVREVVGAIAYVSPSNDLNGVKVVAAP